MKILKSYFDICHWIALHSLLSSLPLLPSSAASLSLSLSVFISIYADSQVDLHTEHLCGSNIRHSSTEQLKKNKKLPVLQ